jgi:hypothetical protein
LWEKIKVIYCDGTTYFYQYFGHFLSERGEYTRP